MKLLCALLLALLLTTAAPAPAQDANQAVQPPEATQQRAATPFAGRPTAPHPPAKPIALTPLTPRERVVQLLDRFTFGPRPGDVDHVLAIGASTWLNQQLQPGSVPDGPLARRLNDLPTLAMAPQQALATFPSRNLINQVMDHKTPYPKDPLLKAVYEVLVYKANAERDRKKADGSSTPPPPLTDEQKAAQKKLDQAAAARLFGDIFALPKAQRMNAVLALSVPDRILLTAGGNLSGEQHNLLFADFNPHEREAFSAMSAQLDAAGNIVNELAQGRVLRDILTDRQLEAVMTAFWFNHFNIYAPKDSDQWYTTTYEREVIRAHALGNFHDLLLATATSPAMMVYLDNWLSIGPDSLANGVNPQDIHSHPGTKGLNENYGREVMELHTVSVNGGYSQADVTALSAILTGWGVDKPEQAGGFQFDYRRHEPGPKLWFGYILGDDGQVTQLDPHKPRKAPAIGLSLATPQSYRQGLAALNILADAPQTAHFIASLLAQDFVADDPPPALVDRLTGAYIASHGDIRTLLRTLIASPEFNSRQYFHNKVKTPEEFIASAFRASATDPQNPGALVNRLSTMGMPLFRALPPTGYYLTADQWMNSTALVDRLNFAYDLTNGKFANQKFDAPRLLAMGLLTARPTPTGNGDLVALHVLEATMIGAPVSAQTNQLIQKQLDAQPPGPAPTDTLNLLTALVMGSPEFQLR